MSNQKEFFVQQEFIKEYFKQISESNLESLDLYLNKILLSHQEDQPTTIGELLNNVKEGNNRTALHFAASRGDLDIFKYLISKGADFKMKDDLQNSAFLVAVEHQRNDIIQYLLDDLHQDVNEQRNTVTALHQASQSGNQVLVQLLLSHGANLNADSQYGTPLMFAAANQQNWLCESFMKNGADPNKKSKLMPPFIHLVIDQNNKELFSIILTEFKDKIDFNIVDDGGWSCVQLCAERGRIDMLKIIIACGGDVDYENQGQSALDVAVQHGHWDCVEVLRLRARRTEPVQKVEVQEIILTDDEKKAILEKSLQIKLKGNAEFAAQKYGEAIEYYKETLDYSKQIQSDYPEQFAPIYTNLASCYLQKKLPKEALEACNQARLLNPKWQKTYYFEGQAYEQLEDYGEAAVSYFDSIKIEHSVMFKDLFDKAIKKGQELHKSKQNSK